MSLKPGLRAGRRCTGSICASSSAFRCGACRDRRRLCVLALAAVADCCSCCVYLANLAFAWTYNVGDAYIFFLPSHYVLALCAGAGVAAIVCAAVAGLRSHGCRRPRDALPARIPLAGVRHVSRQSIAAGTTVRSRCWISSPRRDASGMQRDLWRRYELAGSKRVRVFHARAKDLAFPGSRPKSFRGWTAKISTDRVREFHRRQSARSDATYWSVPGSTRSSQSARRTKAMRRRRLRSLDRTSTVSFDREHLTPLRILRPDREYPIDPAALASAWSRLTAGSDASAGSAAIHDCDRPGR